MTPYLADFCPIFVKFCKIFELKVQFLNEPLVVSIWNFQGIFKTITANPEPLGFGKFCFGFKLWLKTPKNRPPLNGLVHNIHNLSFDLMKFCGKVNQSNIKYFAKFHFHLISRTGFITVFGSAINIIFCSNHVTQKVLTSSTMNGVDSKICQNMSNKFCLLAENLFLRY